MSATSPSIEVQREAAATLCNIALAEENKIVMARGGALPALVSLLQSNDPQREVHACAALANMAEMVEGRTQERMIEEGVLKPLMRLTESSSLEVRKEVSRTLALFAAKRDSHTALVRVHAATRMIRFLADPDDSVVRYGVLGVANLAVSRESHQELFDVGAIAGLTQCVKSTDQHTLRALSFAYTNICSSPANHVACERLGMQIYELLLNHSLVYIYVYIYDI
jgi:vacuolar protein 8